MALPHGGHLVLKDGGLMPTLQMLNVEMKA